VRHLTISFGQKLWDGWYTSAFNLLPVDSNHPVKTDIPFITFLGITASRQSQMASELSKIMSIGDTD
jgi:hypothetical protein